MNKLNIFLLPETISPVSQIKLVFFQLELFVDMLRYWPSKVKTRTVQWEIFLHQFEIDVKNISHRECFKLWTLALWHNWYL